MPCCEWRWVTHARQSQRSGHRGRRAPAVRLGGVFSCAIGFDEAGFFLDWYASKAVIGRIAQNHQDWIMLLDPSCFVSLLFHFREQQKLLGTGRRLPSGQGVGQEKAARSWVCSSRAVPCC